MPSVLKRRYARLYTYASPAVGHSIRAESAARNFAGSYRATILPVTVGGPNLVCGAARVSLLLLPFTTLMQLQPRNHGARACLPGPFLGRARWCSPALALSWHHYNQRTTCRPWLHRCCVAQGPAGYDQGAGRGAPEPGVAADARAPRGQAAAAPLQRAQARAQSLAAGAGVRLVREPAAGAAPCGGAGGVQAGGGQRQRPNHCPCCCAHTPNVGAGVRSVQGAAAGEAPLRETSRKCGISFDNDTVLFLC